MESRPGQPGRLTEQLQSVQIRQRRIIQQLQAENVRRLSDLVDVRQERDAFRKEAGRVRRENAELQSKLDEVSTEYEDLKRERAALARSVVTESHGRSANPNTRIFNRLSVLNEEQSELLPTVEGTTMDKAGFSEVESYLHRDLPGTPKSESELPRPDPVSTAVRTSNDSRSIPKTQVSLSRSYSAPL
ncbi:hypothetical protein HD554DRAFT_2172197 [Boletus coccyginus]|nr:hypothetical protein HD554DRAFT_2172197 [Boletus coccyginus]